MTTPSTTPDGVPISTSHFLDAPSPAPQYPSLFVDDLIDGPLTLEDFLPGYLIIDGESRFITPEEARDLFLWSEYELGGSTPAPVGVSPLHFLNDHPYSPSSSEQHQLLESHGFERDDSTRSFTHSITPCPIHHSSGHVLFARWGEGMVYPELFDQKTSLKVDYSEVFQQSDLKLGGDLPTDAQDEPNADDSGPNTPSAWTRVSSIAELKELPRFIVVKDKRPWASPNEDRTELMASTFSHKGEEDSKCGGFEDDIDAETFVRTGGVCLHHVSVSRRWDSQEKRYRRVSRTTPRYRSGGWFTHTEWQQTLPTDGDLAISYACGYSDAPAVVIVDLDFPKAPKGETLDTAKAEAADIARDTIAQRLSDLGCPTAPSASGKGRRSAFSVSAADADYYERRLMIWRHESGINVELYPPGCARHVMLYGLDGDLPDLEPAAVDDLLTELGFLKDAPRDNDKRNIWGSKGLAAFMEVCDREGWDLAFNVMSQTAFCNGVEQDDTWIHKVRSHLELNYILMSERTTPSGGTYVATSKFTVNEKLVHRWGIEAALLRNTYHPVQDWLNEQPAWDGTDRIDFMLEWCLGASVAEDDSSVLVRTASRDIIMGLVNRAMEPGSAWPRIAILWGPQGSGKSSFLEHLLPPEMGWYHESMHFPLSDEALFDATRTKWLVEFSDPSTRRAEAESAKTFLSRKEYSYRHKFGVLSTTHQYNFHMAMSGNPDGNTSIPADASGYRRYVSVDCLKVKNYDQMTSFLAEQRAQVWAEGLYRYRSGERFQELPDELHAARDHAAQLKTGNGHLDSFFEVVIAHVERLQGGGRFPDGGLAVHDMVERFLTTTDVLGIAKEPDPGRISDFVNRNSVAISAGLKQIGLVQRKVGKQKLRRWLPSPEEG